MGESGGFDTLFKNLKGGSIVCRLRNLIRKNEAIGSQVGCSCFIGIFAQILSRSLP